MAAHNVDVIQLFFFFYITARMHDVCYHFPQVSEYILALKYPEVCQLPGLPSGLTKSPN